jgi:hypothetical protein
MPRMLIVVTCISEGGGEGLDVAPAMQQIEPHEEGEEGPNNCSNQYSGSGRKAGKK